MTNKYFIITVDTEGDNQWNNDNKPTTTNVAYLPRFQELAEKYGFKPVWLSTYEMVNDDNFVKYFKQKQDVGLCEIGAHLHAWNNPPIYKLKHVVNQRPYLIEYPKKIMEEKIVNLTNLIENKFKVKPISHRSGRWATNDVYFELLKKYGYKVDCSVTPHINWSAFLGESGIGGTNYEKFSENSSIINGIFEVPVTIRRMRLFNYGRIHTFRNFLHECKNLIFKSNIWLRPSKYNNSYEMIKLLNTKNEHVMFMIHSSELMPGGSPNFKDEKSIEDLYNETEKLFKYAKSKGYIGITLREYYERKIKNDNNKKEK